MSRIAWFAAAGLFVLIVPSLLPDLPTPAAELRQPPVGQENERKDWTWTMIDERGIALGGGGLEPDDVADLQAQGFGAILNFRGEFPQEEQAVREAGMSYLFINSTYAEEDLITLAEVHRAVAFIEENLAAGRPVYVHCTGGWHRSIVGPVALYMKERSWRFDEAYAHIAGIRPGIEPRFSEALLEYEAFLFDEPKLTLDIWTPRWDVAPNETLPVYALVTQNGAPVADAEVTFTAEGSGDTATARTDREGRANFSYASAASRGMEYVHARGKLAGFVDAYDRNVFWIGTPKTRATTELAPLPEQIDATAGANVTLDVRVKESDGKAANARLALTWTCATLYRDYTGWDGEAALVFAAPEKNGTYLLTLRAHRFAAEPVLREIVLVVGAGGPTPPCVAPAPSPDALAPFAAPIQEGAASIGRAVGGVTAWTLGAIGGVLAAAALLTLGGVRRRRKR